MPPRDDLRNSLLALASQAGLLAELVGLAGEMDAQTLAGVRIKVSVAGYLIETASDDVGGQVDPLALVPLPDAVVCCGEAGLPV